MRRLGKLLMWTMVLSVIAFAVAIAFIDLPAPSRAIEQPVDLEQLGADG